MRIAILLLVSCGLSAQTTIYLGTAGTSPSLIIGTSNSSPVVVTTSTDHGYNPGDTIELWGVCSGGGASPVTGYRKVMSSPAPTHTPPYTFAISDLSGTPIAANGPWCDGSYPSGFTSGG